MCKEAIPQWSSKNHKISPCKKERDKNDSYELLVTVKNYIKIKIWSNFLIYSCISIFALALILGYGEITL